MTTDRIVWMCPECGDTRKEVHVYPYDSHPICPIHEMDMIVSTSATAHTIKKRNEKKEERNA